MIVPMKKVSILMMDRNKEDSLQTLRDLGVIHLENKKVNSPALIKLLNRRTQLEIATGVLAGFTPKKKPKEIPAPYIGDLATRVISLSDRRGKLLDYIFHHQREMTHVEKWGEFNPRDFAFMSKHGVNAYLYSMSYVSFENNAKDVPLITLGKDEKNNVIRVLAFDKIPNERPYTLPERPLSVVEERNFIRKYEMTKLEEELAALSFQKKQLADELKANLGDIEFETAQAGMESIDNSSAQNVGISLISGYVPVTDMGSLKRAASEKGWALCADDPAEDDEAVPTKLENGKFARFIYPVTGFLELVPGYREKDVSLWFLVFFTLFFGMIFGDAAYGAILVIVSLIGIIKTAKKGVPLGFKFLTLMSFSNLIWGILVCSWFGFDSAEVPQFLQNLSLPLIVNASSAPGWISSYNANNFWIQAGLVVPIADLDTMSKGVTTHLMLFCFSIALAQLGIAHLVNIKAYLSTRSLKILSEIGKLGMLLGMYFVILSLVVFGQGFEGVQFWQLMALAGGFVLVFIFDSYEGSIAKSIGASLGNVIAVVLGITNVFSDIMSYIRLWAVGLAGAAIAGMVNSFASPMMGKLAFFIFGLALFAFGHSFNMVLNVLSVLVHAVRLNTLEFSSHVGITWSGFAYKPFAKR